MTREAHLLDFGAAIARRFTTLPPLQLSQSKAVKFEMKPYLQPFERELALRELRALLGPDLPIWEIHGYYVVDTDISEDLFKRRLTFWQRVGRALLEPTAQKIVEFTQSGAASATQRHDLHSSRRLRYGPHDLHEYRGKFFPQLVRSLMTISGVPDHAIVLDPMSGSGTTPCEVVASGRNALAVDLNPLSVLISRVKTAVVLEDAVEFYDTVQRQLRRISSERTTSLPWPDDDYEYLLRWFDADALSDLGTLLSEVRIVGKPRYRDFFLVCLSNIVRGASWQKAVDLRVRKEIKPYAPGSAIVAFREEVSAQLDRIYPYLSVLAKPVTRPTFDIRHGNAVAIGELFSEHRGSVDLLITSPPYATALPYLDTDRLSLIVLGLAPRKMHAELESAMIGTREVTESRRRKLWDAYNGRRNDLPSSITTLVENLATTNHSDGIGFRRRNLPALLGSYFLSMYDAMRSAHALMKPGAYGYYVVGNNSTNVGEEKITIPTDELLFELGARAGWHPEERLPMELIASRDIFRENRGSAETILSFRA